MAGYFPDFPHAPTYACILIHMHLFSDLSILNMILVMHPV